MPRSSRDLRRAALIALTVLASACSHEETSGNAAAVNIDAAADAADSNVEAAPTTPTAPPAATATESPLAAPTPLTPAPDNSALPEVPSDGTDAQAAATVVESYYALIEGKRFAEAWRLWDRGGAASGMSQSAFAANFGKYSDYHANVGAPGAIEGAAGSRYVSVPVQVSGTLRAGGGYRARGSATLRRVGEIDGATPEQKSWHLTAIDLK